MKKLALFFVILTLFFSCNRNVFYEKIDSIPNETWHIDSTLNYSFTITDSLQFYDLYVNVRNTIDYPYQKFYIFLTTEFPSGVTSIDTLGCVLSDPFGEWTGKGSGNFKDNQFLLRQKVRFQQKGEYHFRVQQAMRDDMIPGIANFGITLNYHQYESKQ